MQDRLSNPTPSSVGLPPEAKDRACVVFAQGAITCCNDKFSLIFGFNPGELAGAPLTILFPRLLGTAGGEILGRHRDGTAVWLRIVRCFESNTTGQPVVLIVEDISERKLHEIAATSHARRTVVRHFGVEA